jgi:rubredoxin
MRKFKVKINCPRCGYEQKYLSTDAATKPHEFSDMGGGLTTIGTSRWFECKNCEYEIEWEHGYESVEDVKK